MALGLKKDLLFVGRRPYGSSIPFIPFILLISHAFSLRFSCFLSYLFICLILLRTRIHGTGILSSIQFTRYRGTILAQAL